MMSDDTIKKSDAIRVIEKNKYRLKGSGLTYQILLKQIDEIPSVDIPQSDDWEKYSDKLWKLAYERGRESVRPQGEWIDKAISIIDDMQREGIIDYEQAWEFRMRARMKGADDDSKRD